MNTLMYRGASQLAKTPKASRKSSEKTYRGVSYKKLPKQAKKASLHTYRGVEFSSQGKRKGALRPLFTTCSTLSRC